jgi:uncharacterized protein (TIGR03437 family)
VLGVNNNGQVASFTFPVRATGPGIFANGAGALVPYPSARPGDALVMFITGEGETSPGLDTGAPPSNSTPLSQLPAPVKTFTMSVAGITVKPFFVGIPYGLVGVTQVNFIVPANTPLGNQSVVVNVGGVNSKAATLSIISASSPAPHSMGAPVSPLPVRQAIDAPQAITPDGR